MLPSVLSIIWPNVFAFFSCPSIWFREMTIIKKVITLLLKVFSLNSVMIHESFNVDYYRLYSYHGEETIVSHFMVGFRIAVVFLNCRSSLLVISRAKCIFFRGVQSAGCLGWLRWVLNFNRRIWNIQGLSFLQIYEAKVEKKITNKLLCYHQCYRSFGQTCSLSSPALRSDLERWQ